MAENGTRERLSIIRTRTWTLTLILLVTLVFYLIIDVAFKDEIDLLDFIFTQLFMTLIYCYFLKACFLLVFCGAEERVVCHISGDSYEMEGGFYIST